MKKLFLSVALCVLPIVVWGQSDGDSSYSVIIPIFLIASFVMLISSIVIVVRFFGLAKDVRVIREANYPSHRTKWYLHFRFLIFAGELAEAKKYLYSNVWEEYYSTKLLSCNSSEQVIHDKLQSYFDPYFKLINIEFPSIEEFQRAIG